MSDLQIGLLALAGGLILVVVIYNQWQERRHRRKAEALFQGAQADVLTSPAGEGQASEVVPLQGAANKVSPVATAWSEERREPVLHSELAASVTEPETVPTQAASASAGFLDEVRLTSALSSSGSAADLDSTAATTEAQPAAIGSSAASVAVAAGEVASPGLLDLDLPLPHAWADQVVDAIVRLDFPSAVAPKVLHARQAVWAGRLRRPLRALVLAASGWRPLATDDDQAARALVLAAQLSDRRGAISEDEVDVFLAGVQGLVGEFAARAEVPSKAGLLSHAQALDEFCASVDIQLGFGLVAANGVSFPGTKLRGLAEAAGLSLHEDGRFHYCDDNGRLLFTVGNAIPEPLTAENLRSQSLAGLMLILDVPRVVGGPQVFDRMLMVARQLAQGLGGRLVDSQGRPLADTMIQSIRAKIAEVHARMAANQIPPGGDRALRLFV